MSADTGHPYKTIDAAWSSYRRSVLTRIEDKDIHPYQATFYAAYGSMLRLLAAMGDGVVPEADVPDMLEAMDAEVEAFAITTHKKETH